MRSIAIFNNKGGVGKTTLLCNLAAHYAINENKKVVIIDADPQSNSTLYMIDDEATLKLYNKGSGTLNDIFSALKRKDQYYTKSLPIVKSSKFHVDIIPGDPQVSTFEDYLSKDWFDGIEKGTSRALRTTMIFKDLLFKLESLEYDLAFFDLGPSLGAINRAVLLSSDFFLIPMSADIFSLKAINNIEITLGDWRTNFAKGLQAYKQQEGEPYEIQSKEIFSDLKFAGYVTQQYIAKMKDGQRQAVGAFERIIKQIPNTIEKQLIPLFNPDSQLQSISYNLGEIPNLYSLIPFSQSSNAPIFSLGKEEGIVGAHFSKVKEYGDLLNDIANKLSLNLIML
ncbi:ParA family protein [Spirosoma oryzicola]|uniref:ParA family protein n=1 Tax=Spirosoma oryzicola TaxID=2898794 RepID=UPI001E34E280|nr:ParA family protein [Spirosoma oryzicola]UHG94669.1 ParA family protein [Spirosoma oryzicola]